MRYQFVDCRYELGKPARGRELYLEGHIPGASFLDVDGTCPRRRANAAATRSRTSRISPWPRAAPGSGRASSSSPMTRR